VFAAITALGLVAGCGGGGESVDAAGTATTRFKDGMDGLQGGVDRGMPATVAMADGLRFEPSQVTVKAGATVVWRNGSPMLHTITATPTQASAAGMVRLPAGAEPFASDSLSQGQTFAQQLTVAGEYRYVCRIHEGSGMVGMITVE
jgi:plastocyanin